MTGAPDEVGTGMAFITAPPAPFVPPEAQGHPVIAVVVCYVGEPADGEPVMAPLREFGHPAVDLVEPMPYTAVQRLIEPGNPKGMCNWWAADFLAELPDEAVDTLVEHATRPVSPMSQMLLIPGGVALSRPLCRRMPPRSGSATHPGTCTSCRCGPTTPTPRRTSSTHGPSRRR